MKKIFILVILLLFSMINVKADEVQEYCAKEPYEVGNSFTRFVSNASGLNFLQTKACETIIQNSLKKELNSKFNVEVYAFGAKTLTDGKFKKITIKSNKVTSPYLYLTDFKMESLCPYNKVTINDDSFYFNENFVGKFETKITDNDIKKTLEDKLNKVGKVDVNLGGISLFKISNPNVSIKNKRIGIEMDVQYSNFLITKTTKVKADTSLAIEDGELVFADTHFNGNYTINQQLLVPFMKLINPFRQKVKIDNYNTAEIKVKNLEFKEDYIQVEGLVIVPYYSKY